MAFKLQYPSYTAGYQEATGELSLLCSTLIYSLYTGIYIWIRIVLSISLIFLAMNEI